MTTKDDIEKLFQETRDKMIDSTTCITLMLDFADKASVLLPDLFKEYERLEKDLAASKSYARWLDKQYHAAHEKRNKNTKGSTMKLGIWPFGNKNNENKECVVIKNMPLEQVSCDILKEEIARRKKENHDRRVREANAKADKVDKLIDELCNEIIPVVGKNTSNSTYKETIIRELASCVMESIERYSYYYYHRYPSERNDNMETILDYINRTIDEVDHDAIHISNIFKYMKSEYRKSLLSNIKEEC